MLQKYNSTVLAQVPFFLDPRFRPTHQFLTRLRFVLMASILILCFTSSMPCEMAGNSNVVQLISLHLLSWTFLPSQTLFVFFLYAAFILF